MIKHIFLDPDCMIHANIPTGQSRSHGQAQIRSRGIHCFHGRNFKVTLQKRLQDGKADTEIGGIYGCLQFITSTRYTAVTQ